MGRASWIVVVVGCAAAIGCIEQPAARVLVALDAEDAIAAEANEIRIEVRDRDGEPVADDLYAIVEDRPAAGQTTLPYEITLEPRDDEVSATYEIIATLYDPTGGILSVQRARGGYVADEALELRLVFDDACAGAVCDYAIETCQLGACYEPCVIPTPIGALGDRRSPPVSCPESPECLEGTAPSCVPHGPGQGVHTCVDGVHVITHCAGGCADGSCL